MRHFNVLFSLDIRCCRLLVFGSIILSDMYRYRVGFTGTIGIEDGYGHNGVILQALM